MDENLEAIDLLFFPIYFNSHWSIIAVHKRINLIEYYDSLGKDGSMFVNVVRRFLGDYFLLKHNESRHFTIKESIDVNAPRQINGDDCGVFVLLFAYCISFQIPILAIDPEATTQYRELIALMISKGKLI